MTTAVTGPKADAHASARLDLTIVTMLCLPTIAAALSMLLLWIVPKGISTDRRFEPVVQTLLLIVLLNLLSPPLTLAGVAWGSWALWRRGVSTRIGKATAVVVALAVVATVGYMITLYFHMRDMRWKF